MVNLTLETPCVWQESKFCNWEIFSVLYCYGWWLEMFAGKSFVELFVFILKSIRMGYTYLLPSHGVCN